MRIRPMKTKGNEKRLLKDIVIPAGTIFRNQDGVTVDYINGCIYTIIGMTKDSCGSLIYGIDPRDKELKEWFEDII